MRGFCWSIFIIFLLILPIGNSIKPSSSDVILKDQKSFHINISGSQFWLAIKANFSNNTTISFHKYENYSVNGSDLSCFFELLQSDTGSYFYSVATWAPETSPDYYFQYHLGRFNKSYYHNVNNISGWGCGSSTIFTCNTSGTYYYVIAALTTSYFVDVMINYTGDATFSLTNGTEVFAFGRHDFFGIVNIGCKRGTFIVNGKKEIHVKNQLFASFATWSHSTGYEFLRYHTPSGGKEWSFCLEKKGEPTIANKSPNFQKGLWWGGNGTYSFFVDMNLFGIKKITPDIYLVGADILLP
jgi:hypothetical protein